MKKGMLILALVCVGAVGEAYADNAANCNKAVGIKSTREFLLKRNYRCFKSQVAARAAGYVDFGTAPTPTPAPTVAATATPTQLDFTGTWTTGTSPLSRVAGSDTCDDVIGATQATSLDVDIDVNHDVATNRVRGEDNVSFGRSWGSTTSSSFQLVDTIATSLCGAPGRAKSTYDFGGITADTASVTVTVDITCLGASPSTCQQVWTGSATR